MTLPRAQYPDDGFPAHANGYARTVATGDRALVELWKSSRLYDWLRLKGYVAFDLPIAVTALGALLLLGIAAVHAYIATTQTGLPIYFEVYCLLLIIGCLVIAGGLWLGFNRSLPQMSWFFGDLLALLFLGLYLATRMTSLPGLVALTGRWDFAPGTFAMAFAGAFVALHMSVLLRINVAYPNRQGWQD